VTEGGHASDDAHWPCGVFRVLNNLRDNLRRHCEAFEGMSVVETHNLTKIYQDRQIALNGVSLRVEPGTVWGLLGANGAGKTTLIRLILGLHRPSAGWVEVFGQNMTPNAARLRARMGYLPTAPRFPARMTPITYLNHVGKLFGIGSELRQPRLGALIRAVGLLGASSQPIATLSAGMLNRLGIAASLINEPELLIWDEPTYGLDPEARRHTIELIKELARERTLILSSHLLHDVDELCDHAAVLSQGQLIFQGTIAELRGKMRRSRYELHLDGKPRAIESLRGAIEQLPCVDSAITRGQKIELHLADAKELAAALAEVLLHISEAGVRLVSVQTPGHPTEEAFLELVESDQARGFARATDTQAA
jgi:ABC-2 type transport system ATP-binding protein